jgi:drug/metabolite transporter (DMT)-like permease
LLIFESVATVLIVVLVFKEAVDKRTKWAVGMILMASILLTWTGGICGISLGALGILGSCFLWGLGNKFTRQISAKNPPVSIGIKGLGAGNFSRLWSVVFEKPLPAARTLALASLDGAISHGLNLQLSIP